MEESTSSKKRKLVSHGDHHRQEDEEDDENEEVKIDKFFALINGIREAREILILNGCSGKILTLETDHNIKNKERKLDGERINNQQVTAWNPSFQPEDFMEEFSKHENPRATIAETSQRNDQVVADQQDASKDELDLNLSL